MNVSHETFKKRNKLKNKVLLCCRAFVDILEDKQMELDTT